MLHIRLDIRFTVGWLAISSHHYDLRGLQSNDIGFPYRVEKLQRLLLTCHDHELLFCMYQRHAFFLALFNIIYKYPVVPRAPLFRIYPHLTASIQLICSVTRSLVFVGACFTSAGRHQGEVCINSGLDRYVLVPPPIVRL